MKVMERNVIMKILAFLMLRNGTEIAFLILRNGTKPYLYRGSGQIRTLF